MDESDPSSAAETDPDADVGSNGIDIEADTADTMRGRADESGLKLWLLLRANRLVVAAALTGAVFVAFVAVAAASSPSLALKVESSDVIETLFSAMITTIVTGVTFVVTIGQLVLAQENGPLGDQRERMDDSMAVRNSISELTGSPSPTDPAAFLDSILGAASERSGDLRRSVRERSDADADDEDAAASALRDDIDGLVESVVGNADTVRDRLDGAQFGSFDVVFAALGFNYGRKIAQIEQVGNDHGERLTERQRDLLEELQESLSLFGSAREHVKTLYFQWALIDLSRLIIYAAVPSLIVAGLMLSTVDAGTFPGRTIGVDHVTLVVVGGFAATLFPFALFISYVLRILTLAKRTLAIEPLVLRDSEEQ